MNFTKNFNQFKNRPHLHVELEKWFLNTLAFEWVGWILDDARYQVLVQGQLGILVSDFDLPSFTHEAVKSSGPCFRRSKRDNENNNIVEQEIS